MDDGGLAADSKRTLEILRKRGLTLACAESCTAGLVSSSLADHPGASEVLERGFVTYANTAKEGLLGVSPVLLEQHGAVSEACARAMARGALEHSPADVALAVTGVAGPGGGSREKPVGLVHVAVATRGGTSLHRRLMLAGERNRIRKDAALEVLRLVREVAGPE